MPSVLWGVSCLILPESATCGDIIREFQETLPTDKEAAAPRVELYQLVPLPKDEAFVLGGDDCIVAVLPDASFSCAEIEEAYRRRDAEIEQAQERIMLLKRAHAAAEQREETLQMLQQENQVLRHKLSQCTIVQHNLQEAWDLLHKEFTTLVREVAPHISASPARSEPVPEPVPAPAPAASRGTPAVVSPRSAQAAAQSPKTPSVDPGFRLADHVRKPSGDWPVRPASFDGWQAAGSPRTVVMNSVRLPGQYMQVSSLTSPRSSLTLSQLASPRSQELSGAPPSRARVPTLNSAGPRLVNSSRPVQVWSGGTELDGSRGTGTPRGSIGSRVAPTFGSGEAMPASVTSPSLPVAGTSTARPASAAVFKAPPLRLGGLRG